MTINVTPNKKIITGDFDRQNNDITNVLYILAGKNYGNNYSPFFAKPTRFT